MSICIYVYTYKPKRLNIKFLFCRVSKIGQAMPCIQTGIQTFRWETLKLTLGFFFPGAFSHWRDWNYTDNWGGL